MMHATEYMREKTKQENKNTLDSQQCDNIYIQLKWSKREKQENPSKINPVNNR
jgi:hypothetical protein